MPEVAGITGEGNNGYSLYNAVNYLMGLHCMYRMASYMEDGNTAAKVTAMIGVVQRSIQQHFWQPTLGHYIGDTIDSKPVLDADGTPYVSSDGLHGQVLAYRLGFGDILPRNQMQSHQTYVQKRLTTPWGLTFDKFSQQNWIMSDHSNTALLLRWHQPNAWDTSLRQLTYWRQQKREATRHSAVINTRNGLYGLLNYYG